MANKSKVVVCRDWHHPEITSFVTDEEVGATMPLADFVQCALDELFGSKGTLLLLSKAAATAKLQAASDKIIREMKKTTVYVV